jgi:dihydropyrimidine dehydrogenase (NAD+) subunit PreA
VCPVDDCIDMVELPSGRAPVTWNELSQTQRAVTEDWEAMEKYREQVGINIH